MRREDVYKSTLPQWHRLLQSDLRFLVYTGDQDGILPHLGTRLWIDSLQLPIEQKWRAWHSSTGVHAVALSRWKHKHAIKLDWPTRAPDWIRSLQLPMEQKLRA